MNAEAMTATNRPAAGAAATGPGLGRLTRVELRKMTDTRAGAGLLAATAALTAVVAAVAALTGGADDHSFETLLSFAIQPASILLPVIGILLVSSEYSQRTSLITFALVPRRSRVMAAKVLAGAALAIGAVLLAVAFAAVGAAIASPAAADPWATSAGVLGQTAVYLLASMLIGLAFGAALLSSAPAIVLYFALPAAFAALGSLAFLEDAAAWLDTTRALSPLVEEPLDPTQWGRVATSLALWLALPAAIGLRRVTRGEVG